MTPAPDTGRTADENELREALITFIIDRFWEIPWKAANNADALLYGPLAPILQEAATARKERDEGQRENDYLRASLANGAGPCAYCKLPKEDWAKCADGFPGCARGDDAMLCPHVGSWLDYGEKLEAAEQEAATLRARLQEAEKAGEAMRETLKTIAQGEVMTFDEGLGFEVSFWMDEEEMSALARAALATPVPQNQEAGDHEPR